MPREAVEKKRVVHAHGNAGEPSESPGAWSGPMTHSTRDHAQCCSKRGANVVLCGELLAVDPLANSDLVAARTMTENQVAFGLGTGDLA